MKTKLAALAVIASLALAGCSPQAIEFEAAPETMPAVEPGSIPAANLTTEADGKHTAEDVQISGESPELKAYAREALESHASYYRGINSGKYSEHPYEMNVGGADKWLPISAVNSTRPGQVQFTVDSNYTAPSLDKLAGDLACQLIRFGTDDKNALAGLKLVTVEGGQSGESGTANTKSC